MASGRRLARLALIVVGVVVLGLTLPLAAGATTGTLTDKKERVTITDTGAVWIPALRKLHPTTGTTVKVKVINRSSQVHSFTFGSRVTKALKTGGTETFFYSFHRPGKVAWLVGRGNVKANGFRGKLTIIFPSHFN